MDLPYESTHDHNTRFWGSLFCRGPEYSGASSPFSITDSENYYTLYHHQHTKAQPMMIINRRHQQNQRDQNVIDLYINFLLRILMRSSLCLFLISDQFVMIHWKLNAQIPQHSHFFFGDHCKYFWDWLLDDITRSTFLLL